MTQPTAFKPTRSFALRAATRALLLAAALGTTACAAELGDLPETSGSSEATGGGDGGAGVGGNGSSAGGNDGASVGGNDGSSVGGGTPGPAGDVVATYFVEWSVYGRDYHVADIPAEKLTHVLYGFIPICGNNDSLLADKPSSHAALVSQCTGKPDYSVVVHDKFAALEKSYPGDQWDDPVRGNFGQLIRMKAENPHIKVLPSIGGWTLSDPFFAMANDPANRRVFIGSVVDFLITYDFFDGVDIDWEFPGGGGASAELGSASDAAAYATLMKELREALDTLSDTTGKSYELTSAVGAGPSKIDAVDYQAAVPHMDYVFAMTYDFYGAWNGQLGHQTGLYESTNNDLSEGYNTAAAIDGLLDAGVPANKLVLGVAMYGRGWNGVSGMSSDSPFSGVGGNKIAGSWEPGVIDYKEIVSQYAGADNGGLAGFTYSYDEIAEAPYLFNSASGELITYDNPRSVEAKRAYAASKGLAGLFSWEIDADNGEILDAMIGE